MIMCTVNRLCLTSILPTSFNITYLHYQILQVILSLKTIHRAYRRVSGYRYDIFNIYFSLIKFINPVHPEDGSSKLIQNVSNFQHSVNPRKTEPSSSILL
jgi:hypothetical protein